MIRDIVNRLSVTMDIFEERSAQILGDESTTRRASLDDLVKADAPSLNVLYDFVNLDKSEAQMDEYESELHDCISTQEHVNLLNTYKSRMGGYYLGGMVKCSSKDPLPESKLVEVLKAYANAQPMTGHDIYALQDHQREFETFKEIYYGYMEFYHHLHSKPGSEAYNEAMKQFQLRQAEENGSDDEVDMVKENKPSESDRALLEGDGPDLPPPAP